MNHTKELIERAHRGDEKARETLVLENMGLLEASCGVLPEGGMSRKICSRLGVSG